MFKNRNYTKELLDNENIPEKDLFQNLKELDTINSLLGGYTITFKALTKILTKNKTYTLADIGCGGGDTLKRINKWSKKNNYSISLAGVDLNSTCVKYAQNNQPNSTINFICDDYKNAYNHLEKIDILHASLFCHHLNEREIVELIQFCIKNKTTLIINDLERNRFAYYAIKFLTNIFSKSYLVKNDAPLSVLRGFKSKEWKEILKQSEATNYSIKYKWAFRHEVIVYAN